MRRDMPVYSEQHQTGEDAVAAFKRLFRGWVVREIDKNDYGIDAEVEVVGGDRQLTGVTFKAQIKGTNAHPRGKAHSVRVKISTLNYWRSQQVPVLVFYYMVRSGNAFCRWAHSYDPVAESKKRRRQDSNGGRVSFSFTLMDRVTAQTPERVLEDIWAFRTIRDRIDLGPIPLEISVEAALDEDTRDELIGRINELLNQSPQVLKPFETGDTTPARLSLNNGYFRFSMPTELSSIRVNHEPSTGILPDGTPLDVFCSDIMIVAAIEFAAVGLTRQAIILHERLGGHSELAKYWDARIVFGGAYLDQRNPDAALAQILPALIDDDAGTRNEAHFLISHVVDGSAGAINDESFATLMAALEVSISKEVEACAFQRAAQLRYLTANLEKSSLDFSAAIGKFNQVLELDNRYASRGYFHRDKGGCYADLGRWLEAVETYARAKACSDRPDDIDFVYADSLLHSGRYREALDIARAGTEDSAHGKSRLLVLGEVAAFVVTRIGVDNQHRHQMIESVFANLPQHATYVEALRVPASTDALDGNLLWRAVEAGGDDEDISETSFGAMLTMAWMALDSTFHWVVALHVAIELGKPDEVLIAIADAMLYFCRDEIDQFVSVLSEQIETEQFGRFRRIINRRRGGRPRVIPFIHRIFDDEGNFEVHYVYPR